MGQYYPCVTYTGEVEWSAQYFSGTTQSKINGNQLIHDSTTLILFLSGSTPSPHAHNAMPRVSSSADKENASRHPTARSFQHHRQASPYPLHRERVPFLVAHPSAGVHADSGKVAGETIVSCEEYDAPHDASDAVPDAAEEMDWSFARPTFVGVRCFIYHLTVNDQ